MNERFLTVSADLLESIRKEATGQEEACGLLLALPGGSHIVDRVAYPGPLFASRFELDTGWMLQHFQAEKRQGRAVVGFYHTHPPGASLQPSLEDLAGHPYGSLVLLVGEDGWGAFRADEGEWRRLFLRELP